MPVPDRKEVQDLEERPFQLNLTVGLDAYCFTLLMHNLRAYANELPPSALQNLESLYKGLLKNDGAMPSDFHQWVHGNASIPLGTGKRVS
jgi:hypothetical protein